MNVTIIGTGNMARGIGTRLLAGGNNVTVSGKSAEDAAELVNELRAAATNGATVKSARSGDPIADDVVVTAVWFDDALEFVRQNQSQLAGKTIIEISNPLNASYDGLVTAPGTSAAEEVAKAAPNANVVKAFNTTFAGTLVAGQVAGQKLDVFIAGDDASAKATVTQLVEGGGLRAIDVGPLSRAQQLEGLGFLHITAQSALGTNFGSALKIIA